MFQEIECLDFAGELSFLFNIILTPGYCPMGALKGTRQIQGKN